MSSNVKTSVALRRAADWLEQNSDRHITGTLSVDKTGAEVNPVQEDAYCFCALGRFVKELNDDDQYQAADKHLSVVDKESENVYIVNDNGKSRGYVYLSEDNEPFITEQYENEKVTETTMTYSLGNQRVISYMRELANEAEEKGE